MPVDDDGRYFETTGKIVSDGNTAYADDLNKVTNSIYSGFNLVGDDMAAVLAVAETNSDLSERYAQDPQGTEVPDVGSGKYSALAYRDETAEWVSNAAGTTVTDAAGVDTGEYSAEAHANAAKGWVRSGVSGDPTYYEADGTEITVDGAQELRDQAEGFKDDAEAASLIAQGQNTVSAGDNIRIDTTGTGPYDFEINQEFDEQYYNVAASRAFNTVYTNTASETIWVTVSLGHVGNSSWQVEVDGTPIMRKLSLSDDTTCMIWPVPPGSTYEVTTSGTLNVVHWFEYKV